MDIISEIRTDCPCCQIAYCPLAEFVRHLPERTLVQHKCIEVYKWKLGQELGRDIGWPEAYNLWIESGEAEIFARAWCEGMTHNEVMEEMEDVKKNID